MQQLGFTRSSVQPDHALLTPDTFIRALLPGMSKAIAIVHTAPALGAAFTEYTVEFEARGRVGPAPEAVQRFVYVLEGEVVLEAGRKKHRLKPGGYAYVPADVAHSLASSQPSRAVLIEKPYQEFEGVEPPKLFVGDEGKIPGTPLGGDEALQVRVLIPDVMPHDFQVNTMTFAPGASLALVEIHVMEHGLLMLQGGGIYRLNEKWYPVQAGDFIYMAPYCPQWFGALGKTPAKYLLYKDWNRHPLE